MLPVNLEALIRAVGYVGLFGIVFAESGLLIGFFLPGDSLLFTAGILASQGLLQITILIPVLFLAAVSGDAVGYAFGRRMGRRLFERPNSRLFQREHLLRAERFFAQHGGKAIVFARFVPVVRTFTPIVAGMGAMPYSRFALFNIVGALLWAVGLTLAGYVLGSAFPHADRYVLPIALLIVAVSVAPGAVHLWRENRRELRTLLHRYQNEALCVVLSLLLMAVFAGLGLAARSGPLALDTVLGRLAKNLDGFGLQALNTLASAPVWACVSAAIVAGLYLRRRRKLALTLMVAVATSEACSFAAKWLVDRPRPLEEATEYLIASASFPSGHVVRVAVVLGMLALFAASRRRFNHTVLAIGGVAAVVVVLGLARVASGEHWPTDVLGSYLLAGSLLLAAAAVVPTLTGAGRAVGDVASGRKADPGSKSEHV